jgi:hypothetical protein
MLSRLRRALASGGTCVAVTTGAQHLRSLRDLIERAAPGQHPRLEDARADRIRVHRRERGDPARRGLLRGDLRPSSYGRAGDHQGCVGGLGLREQPGGHYQSQVARPWPDMAEEVREQVKAVIDTTGEFRTAGDLAAFVCR